MNDIAKKQNEQKQLNLLLVQRSLYSRAKVYFTWRVSLALAFAILGPAVSSAFHSLDAYVGLAALVFLVINVFVLETFESAHRMNAAKAQELFDVSVFELPWNDHVVGSKLDAEIISETLDSMRDKTLTRLMDWYAVDVAKIDLETGRLICQRSNAWWDGKLRNLYITMLIVVLACASIAVVIMAMVANLTVAKALLGLVIPILPLAEVVIMQIKNNREASKVIAELRIKIDSEIDKRSRGVSAGNASDTSRIFQDEIWRHRSKCPMIFDWVHNLTRDKHEKQMQFSVKEKVEEILMRKVKS